MQVVLTFFTEATGWHKPLPDVDSPRTLVLVFGKADNTGHQHVIDELVDKYPTSLLAGCSTVAGIFDEHLMENACIVGIIHFHTANLAMASVKMQDKSESWQAGKNIAEQLNATDLKGILVLSDGLNTNGSELAKGLASAVPPNVMITGGLASDPMEFRSTWVLCKGKPTSHIVCGIGFYGEQIFFSTQAKDGWRPFGPERTVTRSLDNILYEIDQQPALELYKEYLGEHAAGLPATALHFPLAIWDEDKAKYVVRTIIGIDENSNSLIFAGDIPNSSKAQLMYGSFDNLVDGAEAAAHQLTDKLPHIEQPVLAFAISCAGRKLVMKDETDQELDATFDILPTGSRQFGFYSFGELAPPFPGAGCSLHNETMTLTVIYEGS